MFSERLLSALMLHIWLTLQLVNHGAVNEHNILIHPRNFQYSLDWACYCEDQPGNICVIISSPCDIIRNVSLSSIPKMKGYCDNVDSPRDDTLTSADGWPLPGYPLTLQRRITEDVRPNLSPG